MTAAVPGRDDTLIQTNSTTGFLIGGPHDRLITRDPHMTETSNGRRWYLNTNGAFDSAYVVCIRPMFILRTISAPDCGTVSTARSDAGLMDAVATAPDAASALLAELGVAANEPTEQKTRLRTALLPDTTTVVTHTVQVIETGAATFLTNWVTGTLSFTMTAPGGAVITPDTATGDVQYVNDETHASYVFSATQPGPYTMHLQATVAPTTGVAVNYYAALESAYLLTAARSRNWLPPAETITVTALFTGPTAIENPQVIAYVRGANGVSATVQLDDLGNGNYRHVYIAPGAPGYIEMEIVATGSVDGVAIERNDNVAFHGLPGQLPAQRRLHRNGRSLGADTSGWHQRHAGCERRLPGNGRAGRRQWAGGGFCHDRGYGACGARRCGDAHRALILQRPGSLRCG
jgi:hypothetical protein